MSNELTLQNETKELANIQKNNGLMSVESDRAVKEMEAMIYVSKKFPRDKIEAFKEAISSCERISLAEKAIYAYPKGGTMIKGASIHLARTLARAWGNLDYGLKEINQENGQTTMMAYCWDMQSNVRKTNIFTVKHVRDTKKGPITLKDQRDIHEMIANIGSRKLRSLIFEVIDPDSDFVDKAKQVVNRTLEKGAGNVPLKDRIREMVMAFEKVGVNEALLEKRLGHKVTAIMESHLIELRQIYIAISTGEGRREQFFDIGSSEGGHADQLNNLDLTPKTEEPKKEAQPEPKKEPEKKPEPQPRPEAFPQQDPKFDKKKPEPKKQNDTIDLPSFE